MDAVLEKGQLREEYESQFLNPPSPRLLARGRIVRETRLADSLRLSSSLTGATSVGDTFLRT